MSFIVCAYYTERYKQHADEFIMSAKEVGVDVHTSLVNDLGLWVLNCGYKPTFIKECLEKFNTNIVYCDIDARFKRFPELFRSISEDIAYWRCNLKNQKHLASGTLFFKNNDVSRKIVIEWEKKCKESPSFLDQSVLEDVLKNIQHSEFSLPTEYCQIFDWEKQTESPVIVHLQASRKLKN